MATSKLRLSDFRNFKDKLLEFSPETTVIVGPNAAGKTNILESLYLLSTGKSFRVHTEEEMINYQKEIGRVKGLVDNDMKLEVVLTRGVVGGKKVGRKKLLVNGVSKRLLDFAGNFKVVLFGPWDMGLITESPSVRRRFLDSAISLVDREYRRALLSYEKGLRQRNKLLFKIREEGISRSQLHFWDRLIIKNGDYLSQKREEFIEFINASPQLSPASCKLIYDKSAISKSRLEQYAQEEVLAATTLVGPHRDDFAVFTDNGRSKLRKSRNLATYGSRGEQRMAILWIKLAELVFIEKYSGEKPTLLLDDIFSELDHEHRDIVMEVTKNQQTIITTADPHNIDDFGKVNKVNLS